MQDLDRTPLRQPNFYLAEIDGEHILFGRARANAHFLNETASLVWKMCDGSLSIREIVAALVEAYPDAAMEIETDVVGFVADLVGRGPLAIVEKP